MVGEFKEGKNLKKNFEGIINVFNRVVIDDGDFSA